MGLYINAIAERCVNGSWHPATEPIPVQYLEERTRYAEEDVLGSCTDLGTYQRLRIERDYVLFMVLGSSDMRGLLDYASGEPNDVARHKRDTGRQDPTFAIPPIAAMRGMPVDASPYVQGLFTENPAPRNDTEQLSFVTVAELLAYDWDQTILVPDWGQTPSSGVITSKDLGIAPVYGRAPLKRVLRNHVDAGFFDLLSELGKLGDPDHVRLVFDFF